MGASMVRKPSFASVKEMPLVTGKQRLLPGVLPFQLSGPEHLQVPFDKIGLGMGSCYTKVFDSTVLGYRGNHCPKCPS